MSQIWEDQRKHVFFIFVRQKKLFTNIHNPVRKANTYHTKFYDASIALVERLSHHEKLARCYLCPDRCFQGAGFASGIQALQNEK